MGIHKCDFIEKRDRELYDAYCELVKSGLKRNTAANIVGGYPCSRFYISPENAYRCIHERLNGKETRQHPRTQLMLDDIMELCGGDYSRFHVEDVVHGPAPSFYLTPDTTKRIIKRMSRRR